MTVSEGAVYRARSAARVGIADRLRAWRIERPRQFRAGVVVAIALIVGIVVGGAYAMGSAANAASVDGQLMALNSKGQDLTDTQNQALGTYNTDVRVVRQAAEGWSDELLTSLNPIVGTAAVDTLRADVATLLADARPVTPATWKSLRSPGADRSAVAAGRSQLAQAKADRAATTRTVAAFGRAKSRFAADLKSLASAMTSRQQTVLAANQGASTAQRQAFVAAEQTAAADMTSTNARAVVAAYDVLTGAPVPPADVVQTGAQPGGGTAQNPAPPQAAAPAPTPTQTPTPTPTPTHPTAPPTEPTPAPEPTPGGSFPIPGKPAPPWQPPHGGNGGNH